MTERTRLISYLLYGLFSAGDAIETVRHSFFDNETILVFVTSRSKANLATSISQNTLTRGYKWLTLKKFKSWGKVGPSLWLNFVHVSRTCSQHRVRLVEAAWPPFYIVLAVFLTDAWFRRRTFHEPNLIHWIRYMKSSASESIRNACFNLEQLRRPFRLARLGISPLERLWNGFDSDDERFMYRT